MQYFSFVVSSYQFKVVLLMLAIPVQFLNEFLLLTMLHLLYAVIDGKVFESCIPFSVDFLSISGTDAILMELHGNEVNGCCHP